MKAWIARDKDGRLGLYRTRPHKEDEYWDDAACSLFCVTHLPEGCNPKWTDEEPIKVEVTITKA